MNLDTSTDTSEASSFSMGSPGSDVTMATVVRRKKKNAADRAMKTVSIAIQMSGDELSDEEEEEEVEMVDIAIQSDPIELQKMAAILPVRSEDRKGGTSNRIMPRDDEAEKVVSWFQENCEKEVVCNEKGKLCFSEGVQSPFVDVLGHTEVVEEAILERIEQFHSFDKKGDHLHQAAVEEYGETFDHAEDVEDTKFETNDGDDTLDHEEAVEQSVMEEHLRHTQTVKDATVAIRTSIPEDQDVQEKGCDLFHQDRVDDSMGEDLSNITPSHEQTFGEIIEVPELKGDDTLDDTEDLPCEVGSIKHLPDVNHGSVADNVVEVVTEPTQQKEQDLPARKVSDSTLDLEMVKEHQVDAVAAEELQDTISESSDSITEVEISRNESDSSQMLRDVVEDIIQMNIEEITEETPKPLFDEHIRAENLLSSIKGYRENIIDKNIEMEDLHEPAFDERKTPGDEIVGAITLDNSSRLKTLVQEEDLCVENVKNSNEKPVERLGRVMSIKVTTAKRNLHFRLDTGSSTESGFSKESISSDVDDHCMSPNVDDVFENDIVKDSLEQQNNCSDKFGYRGETDPPSDNETVIDQNKRKDKDVHDKVEVIGNILSEMIRSSSNGSSATHRSSENEPAIDESIRKDEDMQEKEEIIADFANEKNSISSSGSSSETPSSSEDSSSSSESSSDDEKVKPANKKPKGSKRRKRLFKRGSSSESDMDERKSSSDSDDVNAGNETSKADEDCCKDETEERIADETIFSNGEVIQPGSELSQMKPGLERKGSIIDKRRLSSAEVKCAIVNHAEVFIELELIQKDYESETNDSIGDVHCYTIADHIFIEKEESCEDVNICDVQLVAEEEKSLEDESFISIEPIIPVKGNNVLENKNLKAITADPESGSDIEKTDEKFRGESGSEEENDLPVAKRFLEELNTKLKSQATNETSSQGIYAAMVRHSNGSEAASEASNDNEEIESEDDETYATPCKKEKSERQAEWCENLGMYLPSSCQRRSVSADGSSLNEGQMKTKGSEKIDRGDPFIDRVLVKNGSDAEDFDFDDSAEFVSRCDVTILHEYIKLLRKSEVFDFDTELLKKAVEVGDVDVGDLQKAFDRVDADMDHLNPEKCDFSKSCNNLHHVGLEHDHDTDDDKQSDIAVPRTSSCKGISGDEDLTQGMEGNKNSPGPKRKRWFGNLRGNKKVKKSMSMEGLNKTKSKSMVNLSETKVTEKKVLFGRFRNRKAKQLAVELEKEKEDQSKSKKTKKGKKYAVKSEESEKRDICDNLSDIVGEAKEDVEVEQEDLKDENMDEIQLPLTKKQRNGSSRKGSAKSEQMNTSGTDILQETNEVNESDTEEGHSSYNLEVVVRSITRCAADIL